MAFSSFYGNEKLKTALTRHLIAGTLPHAIILEGEKGLGKKTLARLIAAGLLCESTDKPCEVCDVCRNVLSSNHPDVLF
ncbi:MAG: hypothetical protein IJG23_02695, partial [Clostridia bacterium]|nr:hypothetical protein [Clostridia bacterium]